MKKPLIPITKPTLNNQEIIEIEKVLKSGWITQGPKVRFFEDSFAKFTGAKFAVAVSNCTTGLHLALKALGVQEGDEVITVSHSYIATANSIRYCGAIPVFVDIDINTYNIDHKYIEDSISKRTKLIMCVHQMGMPCNINSILQIANKYNIPVLEDAACAIGSELLYKDKWEKIGKPHSDIACFSFHPRKVLTTGEGGMLTTNSAQVAKKLRLLRHHGMSISDLDRHNTKELVFEDHILLGFNYRLTDIQAAMGIAQLKKIEKIVKQRRIIAKNYFEILKNIDELILPTEPSWAKSNWQSFCVKLVDNIDRDSVMQYLKRENISTKRGIMCAHLETVYKTEPWKARQALSKSKIARDNSLILPLFNDLKYESQKYIGEKLKLAINTLK